MSRAPSERAASPTAGKSRREKKVNWKKVKVFKQAEYRLPWKMAGFYQGRRSEEFLPPEPWLQVAVESGLVEIPAHSDPGGTGQWLEPIDEYSIEPRANREELEALIREGILEVLEEDNKEK